MGLLHVYENATVVLVAEPRIKQQVELGLLIPARSPLDLLNGLIIISELFNPLEFALEDSVLILVEEGCAVSGTLALNLFRYSYELFAVSSISLEEDVDLIQRPWPRSTERWIRLAPLGF